MTGLKTGAKGQSIAFDLFFGVILFIIVASTLSGIWTNKATEMQKDLIERELRTMTINTFDMLIISNGYPAHWEDADYGTGDLSSITTIGLAKKDRFLDKEKVDVFVDLSTNYYSEVRTKLLIGGNDYYFRLVEPGTGITMTDEIGNPIEAGNNPDSLAPEDEKKLMRASVKRAVTYKEVDVIAELTLYRKR